MMEKNCHIIDGEKHCDNCIEHVIEYQALIREFTKLY